MNKSLWLVKAPQFSIIGFILFNIFAMLTYPGGTLDNQSTILYYLSIIGSLTGILGGISMAGVGLTPSDLYFPAHLLCAHWLFRFFFLASLFYTIIIFKTDLIENKYASGFLVFAILILSYIIFSELGPDAAEGGKNLTMQVVAQKIILFCFLIAVYIQTKGLALILDK